MHFLLLGRCCSPPTVRWLHATSSEPGKIVVSQIQIGHRGGLHPNVAASATAEELEGMIRDWIREEVYYREAMAMGLDQDDTIIRRRLRQKLEFVSENISDFAPPTDRTCVCFLQDRPDQFRSERRFTFTKSISLERHRDSLAGDAAEYSAVKALGQQLRHLDVR